MLIDELKARKNEQKEADEDCTRLLDALEEVPSSIIPEDSWAYKE